MDGSAARLDANGALAASIDMRGYKEVRRWVIDVDAPGVREEIVAAVDRINASEEEAHILAEIEANTADLWRLIPE